MYRTDVNTTAWTQVGVQVLSVHLDYLRELIGCRACRVSTLQQ